MDITVFTIVYNGYGKFISQWIKNINNQVCSPKEIIVVLGKNHEADLNELKGIKVINCDSDVMGILRNEAIKTINTEWMLYFSVDDELLPNAIEEIKNKKDYDVVALKYIDISINKIENHRNSATFNILNILNWKEYIVPGYIAVRRNISGHIMYYENIGIPNYPYLFYIASLEALSIQTDNECAIYHRRENSHGDKAFRNNKIIDYKNTINEKANSYFDNYIALIENDTDSEISTVVLRNGVKVKPTSGKILENDIYDVRIERGKKIISAGFAKGIKAFKNKITIQALVNYIDEELK